MPPKVHPVAPREVHGCSQFWKRAGSEFPAFGVWPLGPQPADAGQRRFGGTARGSCAAQGEPPQTRLGPWPPRPPGPLGHPPRPSPSLVELRRLFGPPFLAHRGVLAPEGQNNDFRCSWWNRGSMGLERCGLGSPNGPFGRPHSRFGRGRHFFLDPLFGLTYSPGSPRASEIIVLALRRRCPPVGQKKGPKRRLSSTSDGDGREGCPRGPGDRGSHGPSRVCAGSPCAARDPLAVPPCKAPLPAGCGPRGHTPKAGNSDPARFQN